MTPDYVGPWEYTYRCPHGRIIPFRWEGPNEFDSEPIMGKNGCRKCQEEQVAYLRGYPDDDD